MLNKMKLSTKLIGGFVIVAILTLAVGVIGWYGASTLSGNLETIGNNYLKSIKYLGETKEGQTAMKAAERWLLNPKLTVSQRQDVYNEMSTSWPEIDNSVKLYLACGQDATEASLWKTAETLWDKWKTCQVEFLKLSEAYDGDMSDANLNAMNDYTINVKGPAFSDAEKALQAVIDYNNQMAEKTSAAANASATVITAVTIVGMILGTAIALTLGIFLSISITKPLLAAVNGLNEGAQQVASASEQLSASSQQLAEGNAEQASSIEETSSTLEESASMVQQNSENTKQAAMLAGQTKAFADKGNGEMQEMMSSMGEIKKSSDQIAKIIKVIDEIAFQTNILALNAAVEAARAGDAGMGFAVVAEEVRNLAQRSAQAAKDTAAIIETNIELSEKGVNVAKKVGESLSEITIQAKKVNELMDEIAAASQEQTQGIGQINKAIAQMEKVTQMSASSAEECASSSEELSAQALNLREIVQQLVKLVNGRSEQELLSQSGVNTGTGAYRNAAAHPVQAALHSNEMHVIKAIDSHGKSASGANMPGHGPDTGKPGKKTYVVNPEEVIPLEHDKKDF